MSDAPDRITMLTDGRLQEYIRAEKQLSAAIARAEAAEAALAVAEEALNEAIMQIEYLDECSPSGTSPTILARIHSALAEIRHAERPETMTLETDWLDVDILYPAHIVAPYTPEEIDMLPGKISSRVWATIIQVRDQVYAMGLAHGVDIGWMAEDDLGED